MKTITVTFGVENITKQLTAATVGEVISTASVKAALGYGDAVSVSMNGVEVGLDTPVDDGDSLFLTPKAQTKG